MQRLEREYPLRKSYLRAVVDRIEVDDASIQIIEDSATLEQVIAGKSVPATVFAVLNASGAP